MLGLGQKLKSLERQFYAKGVPLFSIKFAPAQKLTARGGEAARPGRGRGVGGMVTIRHRRIAPIRALCGPATCAAGAYELVDIADSLKFHFWKPNPVLNLLLSASLQRRRACKHCSFAPSRGR